MNRRRVLFILATLLIVSRLAFGGDYRPVRDGYKLIVLNHGYHSSIVVQREHLVDFGGRVAQGWLRDFPVAEWFELGWGDRGFYYEVASLSDVTFRTGASALFRPSKSVMHVATGQGDAATVFAGSGKLFFRLNSDAMQRTVRALEQGSQGREAIGEGLYLNSKFYEGNGSYHIFNTCNSWVSSVLRVAGINASPLFSQTTSLMFLELKLRYPQP
jgi:uncharacterized protein (TIGR02117 family)